MSEHTPRQPAWWPRVSNKGRAVSDHQRALARHIHGNRNIAERHRLHEMGTQLHERVPLAVLHADVAHKQLDEGFGPQFLLCPTEDVSQPRRHVLKKPVPVGIPQSVVRVRLEVVQQQADELLLTLRFCLGRQAGAERARATDATDERQHRVEEKHQDQIDISDRSVIDEGNAGAQHKHDAYTAEAVGM